MEWLTGAISYTSPIQSTPIEQVVFNGKVIAFANRVLEIKTQQVFDIPLIHHDVCLVGLFDGDIVAYSIYFGGYYELQTWNWRTGAKFKRMRVTMSNNWA